MKKVTNTNVAVNNKKVSLENKENLTVLDALIEAGYSRDVIMPREYKYITIDFNGEPTKVYFGAASATKVFLNGERAGLLSLIQEKDEIEVEEFIIDENTTINLSELDTYNSNIVFEIDGNEVPLLRLVEVNGRLNFGDVAVKEGDIVKAYNFYTATQLREVLDLDEDIVIMSDDKELEGDEPVYENMVLDTYVRFTNGEFINKRETTSSFKLLVGDDFTFNNIEESTDVVDEIQEIKVMLNGETIELNNKKNYAVIDALDAANIDAMEAAGKDIIIRVNSMKASFSTEINNEDTVEFSYS